MKQAPCPATLALHCGPVAAIDLALYAAAAGDHNPLHLDLDVAKAAGFEQVLVHGMLSMAYVGRLFSAHFGAGAVRRLSTRFIGIASKGDSLTLTARLTHWEQGLAYYELVAHTQSGSEVLSGTAQLQAPQAP